MFFISCGCVVSLFVFASEFHIIHAFVCVVVLVIVTVVVSSTAGGSVGPGASSGGRLGYVPVFIFVLRDSCVVVAFPCLLLTEACCRCSLQGRHPVCSIVLSHRVAASGHAVRSASCSQALGLLSIVTHEIVFEILMMKYM